MMSASDALSISTAYALNSSSTSRRSRAGAHPLRSLAGGRPAPSPRCGSRRIVAAFERARATGRERALVDGGLIDVPIYAAAKRLLATVDDR